MTEEQRIKHLDQYDRKALIAIIMKHVHGHTPHQSFSIADFVTHGYGELDQNGHWEYEIIDEYIEHE